MAATPTQTYEGDVSLKFLFANFDGITVDLTFPYSTKVSTVKDALLQAWPERVTTTTTPSGMRLLTGGRMLEDGKTLAECRLPKYDAHPTPVNVSILPKGKSYTEVTQSGEKVEGRKPSGVGAGGAAGAPAAPVEGGCCVVS